MLSYFVWLFKGLSEPAPFADELEEVTNAYVRVTMEEAQRGTPRKYYSALHKTDLMTVT